MKDKKVYKDYYLTVPTWSFHQCSSRCLSSSVRGVIISSHYADVFSQNVFSKPWNHFGNDDDSIAYSVSQQILDLKYLNFRAKKNDLKVMLNFGAKIQIWEKNHSESLKDLNFGVKKSTFKSWALLARKLKKKIEFSRHKIMLIFGAKTQIWK